MRWFLFLILSLLLLSFTSPHSHYAQDPATDPETDQAGNDTATQPLEISEIEQVALDPCVETTGVDKDGNPYTVKASSCINLSIGSVVTKFVEIFFVIAVVISLGFLVYGGIKWITSGGDKNAVNSARSTLIAAVVGLVIVFLSYTTLNLVLTFLTGSGISSITFEPLIP